MPALTCSPRSPTPCEARKAARPGIWYEWERGVWLWATKAFIVEVTNCPFCAGRLPLMGTAQDTKAWLDETLADPDE